MYVIIGLGNPGTKYENTRHNVGYDVVDKIARAYKLGFKEKPTYMYAKQKIQGHDCMLVKPTTYMNLSGAAVKDIKSYYKVPDQNIIVIYDDKDTKPGKIRIRKTGQSGGHNGIKDILLHSKNFIRLRIGIGLPKFSGDMTNHVISKIFSKEDRETLDEGIVDAEKAVYDIIKFGVDKAMNKHNAKVKDKSKINNGKNKENNSEQKLEKKTKKEKDKMEKTIYISGHKNPDSDAILTAIALGNLLEKLGQNVKVIAQGEPNPETQYALDELGLEAPEVHKTLEPGSEIILVDHNSPHESLENIEELKIVNVIDHHAVKMSVGYPLYYRAEPVGCTSTIVYKMYRENGVEISPKMAQLMLSAIISDTLLFKSPTCTAEDIKIGNMLEEIAGVNKEEYGMKMLKAGTDLSKYSIKEILNLDAKKGDYNGKKAVVAQVMTVDPKETLERKEEIEAGIREEIEEKDLDLFMLVITDIINLNSTVVALGNDQKVIESGYGVILENNTAVLEGVVSRKKQIVPVLTEEFNK